MRLVTDSPVVQQLARAGYLGDIVAYEEHGGSLSGWVQLSVIDKLRADARFASGPLHALHPEVGEPRCEFRSYNGELGKGSLQFVINTQTGRFHADIDKHNPYNDLVRFLGHTGEVVGHFFTRLFRRV